MTTLQVYWQHESFSHDAGRRDSEEADSNAQATHTGRLSNEHQEVLDGSPVIIEDETLRVYRPADLPPGTEVFVTTTPGKSPDLAKDAVRAGFVMKRADDGQPVLT